MGTLDNEPSDAGGVTGRIFGVSEFCLHDGPGIRSTVFFKGCPLRCQWCHNPEGQSFSKEIMISVSGCTGCGQCKLVCPSPSGCTGCGACVQACPGRLRSVSGQDVTAEELALELNRSADIFAQSDGGVTLSGGEPLSQPDFLMELLPRIRHLHVTLETCGHAPAGVFSDAVAACDLVLFDVKHMDSGKHKLYTGAGNEMILENLKWLCGGDTPFILRVPLIPGVNDSDDMFAALCRRLKGADNLIRVELLPYHRGAASKYAMLGRVYRIDFDPDVIPYCNQNVFERTGIRSIVR